MRPTAPNGSTLCGACAGLIEDGREYQSIKARVPGLAVVAVPREGQDLRHLSVHAPGPAVGEFRDAFVEALRSICLRAPRNVRGLIVGRDHEEVNPEPMFPEGPAFASSGYETVLVPRVMLAPMRRLHAAVDALVVAARAGGLEDGRNIVARLAAGELTVDQLNAEEAEVARARQRRRG